MKNGRTRYCEPQYFRLAEPKELYNSLGAAFKLASRSIVVGHKAIFGRNGYALTLPASALSLR